MNRPDFLRKLNPLPRPELANIPDPILEQSADVVNKLVTLITNIELCMLERPNTPASERALFKCHQSKIDLASSIALLVSLK